MFEVGVSDTENQNKLHFTIKSQSNLLTLNDWFVFITSL